MVIHVIVLRFCGLNCYNRDILSDPIKNCTCEYLSLMIGNEHKHDFRNRSPMTKFE